MGRNGSTCSVPLYMRCRSVSPTNHRMVFFWIERGYRDWLFCIRHACVLFISGLMSTLTGALRATHLPFIYNFPRKQWKTNWHTTGFLFIQTWCIDMIPGPRPSVVHMTPCCKNPAKPAVTCWPLSPSITDQSPFWGRFHSHCQSIMPG